MVRRVPRRELAAGQKLALRLPPNHRPRTLKSIERVTLTRAVLRPSAMSFASSVSLDPRALLSSRAEARPRRSCVPTSASPSPHGLRG